MSKDDERVLLENAVRRFLLDEDAMMEELLSLGVQPEDYGFPFPRVVEMRSALAAIDAYRAREAGQ